MRILPKVWCFWQSSWIIEKQNAFVALNVEIIGEDEPHQRLWNYLFYYKSFKWDEFNKNWNKVLISVLPQRV